MSASYVYWIRIAEHNDIFSQGYVGVTSQTVKLRFSQHLYKAKKNKNLPLCNAIRKYGKENLIVETILIGTEDYVYDVEKILRPRNRIGWNCAQGGDKSSLGRVPKKRTKSHCLNLSNSLKGRTFTEEHRKSISESKKKSWSLKERRIGDSSTTNHDVWSVADQIYADRVDGLTSRQISEKYGFKQSSIHSMIYIHFKKGWVPTKDALWLKTYKGGNYGSA